MTPKTTLYNPKEKVERNKHVVALWKQGYSYNQIAQMTGETPQNIARILRLHKHKYAAENEEKEVDKS